MKRFNLICCILSVASIVSIISLSIVKINDARERMINDINNEVISQQMLKQ